MRQKLKTAAALLTVAAVTVTGIILGTLNRTGDIYPSEDTLIMLYGESHGYRPYYDIELKLWQECYAGGCRDLFLELPYYTGEFLNIWMKEPSDEILDELFEDIAGTLSGNSDFRNLLITIRETCPDTVFHGTDVGHQYDTTGKRYLEYLLSEGLGESEKYRLAEECIRQGKEYYSEYSPDGISETREKYMISNFIDAYSRTPGRVMGIYGSYHTDTASQEVMFYGLKERYGAAVSSVKLSSLAMKRDPFRIGICFSGILFLVMLMVPNILWARGRQPAGYDKVSGNENRALLALERTGEAAVSVCLLIFPAMDPAVKLLPEGLFIDLRIIIWLTALVLMILYECYWARYFRSKRTLKDLYSSYAGFPVAGASLPVTAAALLGIYSGNTVMILSSLILGIGHIGIHTAHRREALRAEG